MYQSLKPYALAVATYFAAILLPVAKLMFGVGLLVIADFITGVLAAQKRGEAITSKKARPTVTKGIGYMIAIIAAGIMQHLFIPDFEVVKIVSGLIAFIELKSLDENLETLTGKSIFGQFIKKRGDV